MTWIPLSEVLDNMLLYIEDQKQEKEPQDLERFKTAVVQAAVNSSFLAPEQLEAPGHTVCVGVSHSWDARGLPHSIARFAFVGRDIQALEGRLLHGILVRQRRGDWYRNVEGRSRKEDVTRNAFQKPEGLHLPSSLERVYAHMNLKDAFIRSTQSQIDALIAEQWVTFHLDHPENKDFVNRTAGMRQFCSLSARGLAHSPASFHIYTAACAKIRAKVAAHGPLQLKIGLGNWGYLDDRSPWPKWKTLTGAPLKRTGDKGAPPSL